MRTRTRLGARERARDCAEGSADTTDAHDEGEATCVSIRKFSGWKLASDDARSLGDATIDFYGFLPRLRRELRLTVVKRAKSSHGEHPVQALLRYGCVRLASFDNFGFDFDGRLLRYHVLGHSSPGDEGAHERQFLFSGINELRIAHSS